MVLGMTGLLAPVCTGNTAAGSTVICICWIAAISVGLRPGIVGAFNVLALAAKPAPEATVACAPALAGLPASCVVTKLSKEGMPAVSPLLAVVPMGVCMSKGFVAEGPAVVMEGRAVADGVSKVGDSAVAVLGASPSKFCMVDSSRPMDLAKAAKLSGLGAFLGSVMMRTWGLSSMVCSGVVVWPRVELAVFCAVAAASGACTGLGVMNDSPTCGLALS